MSKRKIKDAHKASHEQCQEPGCNVELTVEHLLNSTHYNPVFPMNRQIHGALTSRHPQAIATLHKHVTARLCEGVYLVCGDQMHVHPKLISKTKLDDTIREILQNHKKREPDILYRVEGPQGKYLLWVELTCTSDARIIEEEKLFTRKEWRELIEQHSSLDLAQRMGPLNLEHYPFSAWRADAPFAGYRRATQGKRTFPIPTWATDICNVDYSPRAKIAHRTLNKRCLLEQEVKLPTRLVTIEVGPKAYMSKLSLEEIQTHLRPITKGGFSSRALAGELVDVMLRHTLAVGSIMKAHGM